MHHFLFFLCICIFAKLSHAILPLPTIAHDKYMYLSTTLPNGKAGTDTASVTNTLQQACAATVPAVCSAETGQNYLNRLKILDDGSQLFVHSKPMVAIAGTELAPSVFFGGINTNLDDAGNVYWLSPGSSSAVLLASGSAAGWITGSNPQLNAAPVAEAPIRYYTGFQINPCGDLISGWQTVCSTADPNYCDACMQCGNATCTALTCCQRGNTNFNCADFTSASSAEVSRTDWGSTFGIGFKNSTLYEQWYRPVADGDYNNMQLAQCSESLPVMCACTPTGPIITAVTLLVTGNIQIKFDAQTNFAPGTVTDCTTLFNIFDLNNAKLDQTGDVCVWGNTGKFLTVFTSLFSTWREFTRVVFKPNVIFDQWGDKPLVQPDAFIQTSLVQTSPACPDPSSNQPELTHFDTCSPSLIAPTQIASCADLRVYAKSLMRMGRLWPTNNGRVMYTAVVANASLSPDTITPSPWLSNGTFTLQDIDPVFIYTYSSSQLIPGVNLWLQFQIQNWYWKEQNLAKSVSGEVQVSVVTDPTIIGIVILPGTNVDWTDDNTGKMYGNAENFFTLTADTMSCSGYPIPTNAIWNWTIVRAQTAQFDTLTGPIDVTISTGATPVSNTLTIPAYGFRSTFINIMTSGLDNTWFAWEFQVSLQIRTGDGSKQLGFEQRILRVYRAPLVILATAPAFVSNSSALELDGTASCDPNFDINCDSTEGDLTSATEGARMMHVEWRCAQEDTPGSNTYNTPCYWTTVAPSSAPSSAPSKFPTITCRGASAPCTLNAQCCYLCVNSQCSGPLRRALRATTTDNNDMDMQAITTTTSSSSRRNLITSACGEDSNESKFTIPAGLLPTANYRFTLDAIPSFYYIAPTRRDLVQGPQQTCANRFGLYNIIHSQRTFYVTVAAINHACDLPQVSIEHVASRITLRQDYPFFITADVTYNTNAPRFQWSYKKGTDTNITPPATSYVLYPGDAGVQAALAILPNVLIPGTLYTFKLDVQSPSCPDVTTTVAFTTNDLPFWKTGTVISLTPSTGVEFSTVFQLDIKSSTTLPYGCTDASDLPVSYAWYFARGGDEFQQFLGPWDTTTIPAITSRFGAANKGLTSSIYLSCVDALGAYAQDDLELNDVVVNTYLSTITNYNNLIDVADFLTSLGTSATPSTVLAAVNALATAAAGASSSTANLSPTDAALVKKWQQDTCVGVVTQVLLSRDVLGKSLTFESASLQVAAVSSALKIVSDFSDSFLHTISNLVLNLVHDASMAASNAGRTIPPDMAKQFLSMITGVVNSAKVTSSASPPSTVSNSTANSSTNGTVSGSRRRILDANVGGPQDPNAQAAAQISLQRTIRALIGALLKGYTPGAPPQSVAGVNIQLIMLRLLAANAGGDTVGGNLTVELPGGRGPTFIIPYGIFQHHNDNTTTTKLQITQYQNITGNTTINSTALTLPPIIDVAIIKFTVNLNEMFTASALPAGFNFSFINISDVKVPSIPIQETYALKFISSANPDVWIDPYDLPQEIFLEVPFPDNFTFPTDNTTQVSCGAWDDVTSSWSTSGCRLADWNRTRMICACNHASDYSAWNSFVKDVENTFQNLGDTQTVVTIAILVVGVLLPLLLIMWLVLMLWGRYKDSIDSEEVHLGALVLLIKNKLALQMQQRRFFKKLRANAEKPLPLTLDPMAEEELALARAKQNAEIKDSKAKSHPLRFLPEPIQEFLKALVYDHSLYVVLDIPPVHTQLTRPTSFPVATHSWGMFTQFDPYYTRTQRATVLAAVIVGNLLASSLLFELKLQQNVTIGFLIATVILSAFVTALPVKIFIRWLFRATEAETGSKMHRVTQIYRITELYHDLLPGFVNAAERADIEMLIAFKDFKVAKSDVEAAENLLRMNQQKLKGGEGKCKAFCRSIMSGASFSPTQRPSIYNRLGLQTNAGVSLEDQTFSQDELVISITKAKSRLREARINLKKACVESKTEWDKVPRTANARVETLRKQQSNVMKFASIFYDEIAERPRERPKMCGARVVYVAWAMVLGYFAFALFYCAAWVLARTNPVPGMSLNDGMKNNNAVIQLWLTSSFIGVAVALFVVEPVFMFLRFGGLTWCLRRCGNGLSTDVKPQDLGEGAKATDNQFTAQASMMRKAKKLDDVEKEARYEKYSTSKFYGEQALEGIAAIVEAMT